LPPGKWVHKKSLVFIVLLLANGILSAFFLPYADILLQKLHLQFDFHRVYSRIYLALTLISFAVFSSYLNIRQDIASSVCSRKKMRSFLSGAAVGCTFIFLITVGAVITDIRIIKKEILWNAFAADIFSSIAAGIVIGLFETLIVWSILFRNVRRDFGDLASVLIIPALFGMAHFIKAPEIAGESGGVMAGLKILTGALRNLTHISAEGYSFVGLFLFGVFSTLLFIKTDNYYLLAGVHAGAVFLIKFNRVVLDFYKKDWEWLFGTSTGIDSVAGCIIMAFLIFLVSRKGFGESPFIRSLMQRL
jgi:uncharacterized protein